LGDELVEGFRELTEALEAKADIAQEFNVRRVTLDLQPRPYSPEQVVETRKLLGASQAVFAAFIGASLKTLQAWEQGHNPVAGTAARLMDEIRHDPQHFLNRLRSLATPRASAN
jgi:putative transcriptional regulator